MLNTQDVEKTIKQAMFSFLFEDTSSFVAKTVGVELLKQARVEIQKETAVAGPMPLATFFQNGQVFADRRLLARQADASKGR